VLLLTEITATDLGSAFKVSLPPWTLAKQVSARQLVLTLSTFATVDKCLRRSYGRREVQCASGVIERRNYSSPKTRSKLLKDLASPTGFEPVLPP